MTDASPETDAPRSPGSANPRRPRSRRSARARLWIPNQPGAWVMVLTPALAGIAVGGPTWRGAWVAAAWLACYCTQFAGARWFVSHCRRRYLAPALTYAAITCAIGLPLLILTPGLLWWAVVYVPLAAASFALAWMRRDRGFASQTVACLAAGAIGAVTVSMGSRFYPDRPLSREALTVGVVFALFEIGQVLFVPSMMVRRDDARRRLYAASTAFSAVLAAGGFVLHPVLGAAGLVLLARAAVLPALVARGKLPPLAAAPSELATSLVMLVAVIVAVPAL
ncbi:YwiC-like protein [Bifidobacterium sp. DSM 109958]|uniref:YwiC-like protein n=1 Tax=Bifidobacterium moraviense TaxID=2675323 RepID=A0A7Y0F2S0_9BIFI|nr:YwiC-like family protein [Bifidobacterium sp. DSM 109958]NMN00017.1 YwiC-like protein [Bifidobacterium sp. DSM 109958]